MIPSFIILFREVLEISIILSVVLAATHGICNRGRFIALGFAGGLVGSILVAVFATNITEALEGSGQEIFNGAVLLLAAFMIGWTTVWMQRQGREMVQKIKQIGACVNEGTLPLTSVAVVVALSMWREGAEIALFMTGIISTRTENLMSIMMGAAAGGALAALIGALIYFGLIRLSNRHLFTVVGWLLTLLASGMSAAAAGFLVAADRIPALIPELWDSSAILSDNSIIGKILHAMLGYSERPSGIQLVFYVATFIIIVVATRMAKPAPKKPAA